MLVMFTLIVLLLLVNQFRPGLYSDSWTARSSRVVTHPVNSSVKTPDDTCVGLVKVCGADPRFGSVCT